MKTLNDLEIWLKNHLPEVADDLIEGATKDELQNFSSELGVDLPDDFLQLYTWHNGQADNASTGPWFGLTFLPLEAVRQEYKNCKKHLDKDSSESLAYLSENMKSTPPGFVRTQNSNAYWIPFAHDWGGNFLGIDLDPDDQGTYGQVINFGRDEERKIAISSSLSEFINWMILELNSGNFNIIDEDDGGRSFNILRPETSHFLDAIALIFPED